MPPQFHQPSNFPSKNFWGSGANSWGQTEQQGKTSRGTGIQSSAPNSLWIMGFPGGSDGKESACNAGDQGSVPGLGRFPEEGNGNSLQYSCLENAMDRGAWRAIVHGVTESQTQLTLSFFLSLKAEIQSWC